MEELKKIIEDNKIKLTPPQKKIYNKLMQGYKLTVVNKHHMSGGQFMWKSPNSDYLEHAGSVYKAFFNINWAIKKQSGIIYNIGKNFII